MSFRRRGFKKRGFRKGRRFGRRRSKRIYRYRSDRGGTRI